MRCLASSTCTSPCVRFRTHPSSTRPSESVNDDRTGTVLVRGFSVRTKDTRSAASASESVEKGGMPAAGNPARSTIRSSSSVRRIARAAMAGPSSPPLPSVPWHEAQRMTNAFRPLSTFWADGSAPINSVIAHANPMLFLANADPPCRVVHDFNANGPRAFERMCQPVRPLDRQHTVVHAQLVEPEIVRCGAIEPVEIDVIERQSSTAIFMNECERRTADLPRIDVQAFRKASDEGRLPGAKISREQQDVASPKVVGQRSRDCRGLLLRAGRVHQLTGLFRLAAIQQ